MGLHQENIKRVQNSRDVSQDSQNKANPELDLQRNRFKEYKHSHKTTFHSCNYEHKRSKTDSCYNTKEIVTPSTISESLTPMAYLKKTPKGGNKIASKISINVAAAIVAELPTKPN